MEQLSFSPAFAISALIRHAVLGIFSNKIDCLTLLLPGKRYIYKPSFVRRIKHIMLFGIGILVMSLILVLSNTTWRRSLVVGVDMMSIFCRMEGCHRLRSRSASAKKVFSKPSSLRQDTRLGCSVGVTGSIAKPSIRICAISHVGTFRISRCRRYLASSPRRSQRGWASRPSSRILPFSLLTC